MKQKGLRFDLREDKAWSPQRHGNLPKGRIMKKTGKQTRQKINVKSLESFQATNLPERTGMTMQYLVVKKVELVESKLTRGYIHHPFLQLPRNIHMATSLVGTKNMWLAPRADLHTWIPLCQLLSTYLNGSLTSDLLPCRSTYIWAT